jgi:hypothetical protein
MYKKRKYEKGMALPLVLFLSILALAIIGIIMMFLISGKRVGVISESYQSVIEAARGGAYYIMKQLDLGAEIYCYNSNQTSQRCKCYEAVWVWDNITNTGKVVCSTNASIEVDRIDLGSFSNITSPSGDVYELEAILFYKKTTEDGQFDIYSFEIRAKKQNSNEKSIIDVIYKTPSKSSI